MASGGGNKTAAEWRALAEAVRDGSGEDDAPACFQLGECYYWGQGGVREDYAQAIPWFTRAAVLGHAAALYRLGRCHEQGLGMPKDPLEAARLYRASVEHGDFYLWGHPQAKARLAKMAAATVAAAGSGPPAVLAAPRSPRTPRPRTASNASTGSADQASVASSASASASASALSGPALRTHNGLLALPSPSVASPARQALPAPRAATMSPTVRDAARTAARAAVAQDAADAAADAAAPPVLAPARKPRKPKDGAKHTSSSSERRRAATLTPGEGRAAKVTAAAQASTASTRDHAAPPSPPPAVIRVTATVSAQASPLAPASLVARDEAGAARLEAARAEVRATLEKRRSRRLVCGNCSARIAPGTSALLACCHQVCRACAPTVAGAPCPTCGFVPPAAPAELAEATAAVADAPSEALRANVRAAHERAAQRSEELVVRLGEMAVIAEATRDNGEAVCAEIRQMFAVFQEQLRAREAELCALVRNRVAQYEAELQQASAADQQRWLQLDGVTSLAEDLEAADPRAAELQTLAPKLDAHVAQASGPLPPVPPIARVRFEANFEEALRTAAKVYF